MSIRRATFLLSFPKEDRLQISDTDIPTLGSVETALWITSIDCGCVASPIFGLYPPWVSSGLIALTLVPTTVVRSSSTNFVLRQVAADALQISS